MRHTIGNQLDRATMTNDARQPGTQQEESNALFARFMRWTEHFGNEFYIALFVGWLGQAAFAFSAHIDWRDCARGFFILWFSGAAAFFVGTIFGFLFGFPKSKNGSVTQGSSDAYRDNTNLEDVSDWLTKIVIGISIAQFKEIALEVDRFAKAIDNAFPHDTGSYPVSIATLVYGFVCGFMAYYTWARSRFRRHLEGGKTA
jgi:hypothetical protein